MPKGPVIFDCHQEFYDGICDACDQEKIVHEFHFGTQPPFNVHLCWPCFKGSIPAALLPKAELDHILDHFIQERDKRGHVTLEQRPTPAQPGPTVDDEALERAWVSDSLKEKLREFNERANQG